jgi:hypothetical protein
MSTNWSESVPFNFEKLRVAEAAATWAMDGWFIAPGADRRGDGAYFNVPPSVRSDEKTYRWLVPLQQLVTAAPEAPIRARTIEAVLYRTAPET